MTLAVRPITQREAFAFITEHHRHNVAPRGDVIRLAVIDGDQIVAVGIAGRPVARHLNDGTTLEVTRVASTGARNACSLIYGRLRRAAFALGYRRLVTYTRKDEPGSSLRAAGWTAAATVTGGSWDKPSRPRTDRTEIIDRIRWECHA